MTPHHRSPANRPAPSLLAALIHSLMGAGLLVAASGAAAQATVPTVTLREVTVSGESEVPGGLQKPYAGGQVARGGSLGVMGTSNAMDVPFSTVNYTSELVENQQARTLADLLVNDPSVRIRTSTGGFSDDFLIRGLAVGSGDVALNGLFGLSPTTHLPTEMLERVELVKGPASFLNGISPTGATGGAITAVTKRAGEAPLTRLTTTFLSKGQLGAHLDVGRRFGDQNEWGIRVNGAYRNGESTIDDGRQKLAMGSLGLDYRSDRLRWSLDAYSQDEDIRNFRPQISFLSNLTSVPAPPSSSANFYPGTSLNPRDSAVLSRIEYDLTDRITGFAAIGYHDNKITQTFPASAVGVNAAGNFTLRNSFYDSYGKTTTGEIGARGKFQTGSVGHAVAVSFSRMDAEAGNAYIQAAGTVASNIYNPAPLPVVTAPRTDARKASDTSLYSLAVVDTMSFFNDRFLLNIGLRRQTVDVDSFNTTTGARSAAYKESSTTPLVGVVFKPVANVSLYANYTEGLTQGASAPVGTVNFGEVFPPYKTKQKEAGVKVDFGSMTTVASVFEITRPSAITENNVFTFGGEQRNRGLELSAYGEVQRGLRLMAGATFLDAELTRTASGVNQGKTPTGVPDRTFNVAADWDTPWLQGLSLNGRVLNTSKMYFNANNTVEFPSWTRTDIGARYRTRIASKNVVFRANVENVFDKTYWLTANNAYATVAAPRTVVISAAIDF